MPKLPEGEVLLVNIETGELWVVDHYALKERGYPEGGWTAYENLGVEELVNALRAKNGYVSTVAEYLKNREG
jgi:hypothetical protein